ncbi:MAG TPA: hypothetical protein VJ729_02020 [Nitrososphaeraceae archaeon]|nr:hypothetical protein [Nitrososphaeraceae archaeon]
MIDEDFSKICFCLPTQLEGVKGTKNNRCRTRDDLTPMSSELTQIMIHMVDFFSQVLAIL